MFGDFSFLGFDLTQGRETSFKGYTNSFISRSRPGKAPMRLREGSAPAIFVDPPANTNKSNGKSNGVPTKHRTQSTPNILNIQGADGKNLPMHTLQMIDGTRKPWKSTELPNNAGLKDNLHGSLEELCALQKKRTRIYQNDDNLVTDGHLSIDDAMSNDKAPMKPLPLVTIFRVSASPDVEVGGEDQEESCCSDDRSNLEALSMAFGGSLEKLHRQITRRRMRRHHGSATKESSAEPLDIKLLNPNDDTHSNRSAKSLRSSLYSLFRKSSDVINGQPKSPELKTPTGPNEQ